MYDLGEDDFSRIVGAVTADPAVQAHADQLRAARAGPPPGQDPALWRGRQDAALRALVRAMLARIDAEAPGVLNPEALEWAARYWEGWQPPSHATPGSGGDA
jgi:hypothetical protein